MNYHLNPSIEDISIPNPELQYNGNISSIGWAQVNQSPQLNAFTYDALDRLSGSFTHNSESNTSYGYDVRGNITGIVRYGLVNNATALIDSLAFRYKAHNPNVLDKVLDSGLDTKGYKVNHADLQYEYDDNGNLIHDPQKGVRMKYNYLDLCEEISWADGRKIQFTYDAGGALLRKEVIPNTSAENTVIDYIGAIEYKANDPYIIHHAEGRFVKRYVEGNDNGLVVYPGYEEVDGGSESFVLYIDQPINQNTDFDAESIESSSVLNSGQINYEASNQIKLVDGFQASRSASFRAFMGDAGLPSEPPIWISEWDISDHLGNLRLTYSDLDGNGSINDSTEILQTAEYYPFGMKKTASTPSSFDNLYGYNGIEEVNDFGLDVNMATFRTLDPALGRWWSVDPKAEVLMGLSPYNSMNNSPLVFNDPNGDIAPLVFVGAALIGGGLNLASNWSNVNGLADGLSYFGSGAVGGAVGVVNPALGGLITAAGNLSTDYANGTLSNLNGVGDWVGHLALTGLEATGAGAAGTFSKGVFNFSWSEFGRLGLVSSTETAQLAANGINLSTRVAAERVAVQTSTIVKSVVSTAANAAKSGGSNLWKVGSYNKLKGLEAGLDAHHVGQKAILKKLIPNYNKNIAPSILVPKVGHTIRGTQGIVSRSTKGLTNARQVLARDILELRRVYGSQGIPNRSLQELIRLNKEMYPGFFIK